MRWFYDVKKRKKILGILIFILCVLLASQCAKLISRSNNNTGNSTDVITTSIPEPTVPEITSAISPTTAPTTAPTTTATATPTILPTISPTVMVTPTPTVIPTPEMTPTPKITPTPKVTPKTTPTPTKNKQTPTVTVKVTPQKTLVKTSTPRPVSTPPKVESTKVVLKYKNGNASSSTDSIYPMFKVTNSGTKSIKLSDIKIRYYYTKEENKAETFWCDSFSRGATNVYGNFVSLSNKKSTADRYLEIGFSEKAGELKAGESVELAVGFAKNDWSEYNQKNDYSYSSSKTYFEWNRVTLFVSGKVVFGNEP